MTTEAAIITAAILGGIAFKAGKTAEPCRDSELLAVIGNMDDKKIGASIPVLKAWSKSWDAMNLAKGGAA